MAKRNNNNVVEATVNATSNEATVNATSNEATVNATYVRVGAVEASNATDIGNELGALLLTGAPLTKTKAGPGRPPAPEAFTVDLVNPPEWAIVLTGTSRWIARLDSTGKRPDPTRTVMCELTSSVAPSERSERARKGIAVDKLTREQAEVLFAKLSETLKG